MVTVNGIVAHIGQVIDPAVDVIKFSDQIIRDQENLVYYVFNKPRDIVTTSVSYTHLDVYKRQFVHWYLVQKQVKKISGESLWIKRSQLIFQRRFGFVGGNWHS